MTAPKHPRCPNGTRRNKAGDCIPVKKKIVDANTVVVKLPRCPNGTRRNNKGDCVPKKKPPILEPPILQQSPPIQSPILEPPILQQSPILEPPILLNPVLEPVKKKRTRCPKGTRKNRQGICQPVKVKPKITIIQPTNPLDDLEVEEPVLDEQIQPLLEEEKFQIPSSPLSAPFTEKPQIQPLLEENKPQIQPLPEPLPEENRPQIQPLLEENRPQILSSPLPKPHLSSPLPAPFTEEKKIQILSSPSHVSSSIPSLDSIPSSSSSSIPPPDSSPTPSSASSYELVPKTPSLTPDSDSSSIPSPDSIDSSNTGSEESEYMLVPKSHSGEEVPMSMAMLSRALQTEKSPQNSESEESSDSSLSDLSRITTSSSEIPLKKIVSSLEEEVKLAEANLSSRTQDLGLKTSVLDDKAKVDLENMYKAANCTPENYYTDECSKRDYNKFLLKKEEVEHNLLQNAKQNTLYPSLNDPNFVEKIAAKAEFANTKYVGPDFEKTVKQQADIMASAPYELAPHQAFVKNFMSSQTPYSSMLLYHGLGSGKTCSAIGVTEEMRDYMRQMGINKRIVIVASENVQDNFRLQLFDERQLKEINGVWSMRGCIGNKLLKEINPMNMRLTKEKIVSQIRTLINANYIFMGYVQFANYIIKTAHYTGVKGFANQGPRQKSKIQVLKDLGLTMDAKIARKLKAEFENRLIVIDEVHNIRKSDENENKQVAKNLEMLVNAVQNMRLLFLSATPMYNNYREIIWLLNLMNINDRRGKIEVSDVFDAAGNFKPGGQEILARKATGYVSFVRGENPYTFPYRVYPTEFAPDRTFNNALEYPFYQMNLKRIQDKQRKRILSLYLTTVSCDTQCGDCQYCCYQYIIHNLRNKKFTITTKHGQVRDMPSFKNMESFGYTMLQTPIESLIISYPVPGLKNLLPDPDKVVSDEYEEDFSKESEEASEEQEGGHDDDSDDDELDEESPDDDASVKSLEATATKVSLDPHLLTGKKGLARIMKSGDKSDFEYRDKNAPRIFNREHIGKYSAKIESVLKSIVSDDGKVSDGIILIYSQYIDGGLIPMALALESMGFTRYGQQGIKPLFKERPTEVVDSRSMEPKASNDSGAFMPARYSMITGDKRLSPNNDFEVKGLTDADNQDGSKVKVILISRAGSEGIDFKYIRQVHILDPWYNMNRIEQIIGRAVRNFSHKDLEFEHRNVQIFMHGTVLSSNKLNSDSSSSFLEEAADLYVYRVAEFKAVQIGKVTRELKQTAIDCLINQGQTEFTQENMMANIDKPIKQILSTGITLNNFKIGDAPFSPACDYMASCDYDCATNNLALAMNSDTYDENFIKVNNDKIMQRIRMLFKESFFYKKDVLIKAIQTPKVYPRVQIFAALTQLIEDQNEFLNDRYGRNGRLINIDDYYLFQPIELNNPKASIFERSKPVDFKHTAINFDLKRLAEHNQKLNQKQNNVQVNKPLKTNETIKSLYILAKETQQSGKKTLAKGDTNWYRNCGLTMNTIVAEFPDTQPYLDSFLVAHIVESLMFDDKIELMNLIYRMSSFEPDSFEKKVKDYFDKHVIVSKSFSAYITYKLNQRKIMVLTGTVETGLWSETLPEDEREIAMAKETRLYLEYDKKQYNEVVGFIGYEKGNKDMGFKTKNMGSSRDTGAKCEQAVKKNNVKKLNDILGEEIYEATDPLKNLEICIIKEFMLRYFDEIRRNNKRWFFTPEMAIFHKLYNVIV